MTECETCYGEGEIVDYTAYGDHRRITCPTCDGDGHTTCGNCGGNRLRCDCDES